MNKRIMIALIVIVMISSSIGLLQGCAEQPAPTPAPETPIPAHYSTFTEEGLYSISYPPDWEPALSIIEELEQEVMEQLKREIPELPAEQTSIIFFAGMPFEEGYMPNVNIIVETLPKRMTLDEYVEANIQMIKEQIKDYHEFGRISKNISGKDAFILDYEGTYFDLGKAHWLQMYIVENEKIAWGITCTCLPDVYSEYEHDFHSIVNSFRLLK